MAVIRQRLNDVALGNTTALAALEHPLHFTAQAGQSRDLAVNVVQMKLSNLIHLSAGPLGTICES
jgi:hypothetical protein